MTVCCVELHFRSTENSELKALVPVVSCLVGIAALLVGSSNSLLAIEFKEKIALHPTPQRVLECCKMQQVTDLKLFLASLRSQQKTNVGIVTDGFCFKFGKVLLKCFLIRKM